MAGAHSGKVLLFCDWLKLNLRSWMTDSPESSIQRLLIDKSQRQKVSELRGCVNREINKTVFSHPIPFFSRS